MVIPVRDGWYHFARTSATRWLPAANVDGFVTPCGNGEDGPTEGLRVYPFNRSASGWFR